MDMLNQNYTRVIKSILILLTLSLVIRNTVFGDSAKELEKAILNYNLNRVVKLLERRADPNKTAHTSYAGWDTLLTFAINNTRYPRYMYKHMELEKAIAIIEALLTAGADPNMSNHPRRSPLVMAIRRSNLKIVEILLQAGANPNMNGRDMPLIVAIQTSKLKVLKTLLKAGANPNQKSPVERPLILAIKKNKLKIVEALLKAGADPSIQDENGKTALMIATEQNLKDIKIALEEAIRKNCAKSLSNNS